MCGRSTPKQHTKTKKSENVFLQAPKVRSDQERGSHMTGEGYMHFHPCLVLTILKLIGIGFCTLPATSPGFQGAIVSLPIALINREKVQKAGGHSGG